MRLIRTRELYDGDGHRDWGKVEMIVAAHPYKYHCRLIMESQKIFNIELRLERETQIIPNSFSLKY